jgi:Lon protease-like protein
MKEEIEIPIFPLNLVAFPGSRVSLHVFEPRYRQMLQYCLKNNTEFGICLIKSGKDVGDSDTEPFDVGTLVSVVDVLELPDGRFDIQVQGIKIFKILHLLYDEVYLKALVSILQEPEDKLDFSVNEKRQVMKYLTDYINSIAGLKGEWISDRKVPLDLEPLFSYGISLLDIPNARKQEILENTSLKSRIGILTSILLRETKKNQIKLNKKFLRDKTILN